MPLTLVASDRFVEHQTPPGHPESSERAEVFSVVAGHWRQGGGSVVAPGAATDEQLARVHAAEYLQRIQALDGRAAKLDPDTFTSAESVDLAHLAAGAVVGAVDRVMTSGGAALAMVRPPGHHAESNRAMGFCLYNNIAVAAAHARTRGASRVAIVDYDVHHGNGTQHMFEDDPDVLYVSTHQYPFYPGTGAVDEIGRGKGEGFTVNVPLEAGAADEDYRLAFSEVVLPVLRQYKPDILLISAGFDAHQQDPLAGMRVTTPAFAAMTRELAAVAVECCAGRLVAVTEGGYNLRALGQCLIGVLPVLNDPRAKADWPPAAAGPAPTRGAAAVAQAKQQLGRFWKL